MPISSIYDKRILLANDSFVVGIDGVTLKIVYEAKLTTEYDGDMSCIDNSAEIIRLHASVDEEDVPEKEYEEIGNILSDILNINMDKPMHEILDAVEDDFTDGLFYNLPMSLRKFKKEEEENQ